MSAPPVIGFSGYRLECRERRLRRPDGVMVQLPPQAFSLLRAFVESPRTLLSKQDLFQRVWAGRVVEENTLSRTVSALRALLNGREGSADGIIVTVSGAGYRFEADVENLTVGSVKPATTARRPPHVPHGHPDDVELGSVDQLLQAKFMALRHGAGAVEAGAASIASIMEANPRFAKGWVGLSNFWLALSSYGQREAIEAAVHIRNAAVKVAACAPDEWSVRLCKSNVCFMGRDWSGMHEQLLDDEPSSPIPWEGLLGRAMLAWSVGLPESGLGWAAEIVHANPMAIVNTALYQTGLLLNGNYAASLTEYQRSQGLPGDRGLIEYQHLMLVLAQDGDAAPAWQRLKEHDNLSMPVVGELVACHADHGAAIGALQRALVDGKHSGAVRQVILGQWLAQYGETRQAMDVLWSVFVEGQSPNLFMLWQPALAEVRSLPRFRELLQQVGIIDYHQHKGTAISPAGLQFPVASP